LFGCTAICHNPHGLRGIGWKINGFEIWSASKQGLIGFIGHGESRGMIT